MSVTSSELSDFLHDYGPETNMMWVQLMVFNSLLFLPSHPHHVHRVESNILSKLRHKQMNRTKETSQCETAFPHSCGDLNSRLSETSHISHNFQPTSSNYM